MDNLAMEISWEKGDVQSREVLLANLLARVSREAMQGETLNAVLQAIVDCIARSLPITVASIILLNDTCTHFTREVWAGEVELAWPGQEAWPVSKGVAGRCVRTGQPQWVTCPRKDPDYVAGHPQVQAEYLVPIRHQGHMDGVLNLESVRTDLFTARTREVFDAIALQIGGVIHMARQMETLEQANRNLHALSMQDGLTGIANRRCFDQRLEEAFSRHVRAGRTLSLLMVDVDHFKLLNDACGHLCGDECLRELARLCRDNLRAGGDVVARYGGEELVLLLHECDSADARTVAERLRAGVQARGLPHPASPVARCVTVSIGVASVCPVPGMASRSLIEAADAALYEAKAGGRNKVVLRCPARG